MSHPNAAPAPAGIEVNTGTVTLTEGIAKGTWAPVDVQPSTQDSTNPTNRVAFYSRESTPGILPGTTRHMVTMEVTDQDVVRTPDGSFAYPAELPCKTCFLGILVEERDSQVIHTDVELIGADEHFRPYVRMFGFGPDRVMTPLGTPALAEHFPAQEEAQALDSTVRNLMIYALVAGETPTATGK